MSRNKMMADTITEAKPHTVKKFELIERYVDEWARKILGFKGVTGREGSKGVIYIDCMCNSGVYKDGIGGYVDGTALRVAKRLDEIITNYPGKQAILIFNDLREDRVEQLKEEIEKAELNNIRVSYHHGDCNSFLRGLNLEGFKQSYNTLLLYDPYNASIDWDAVTPFLNRWGEVIINHMVFDTTRGAAQAKKLEVIERYQETYQRDIETIIEMGKDKKQLNRAILSIIAERRDRRLPGQFIASFPFFNRVNGLVYNLIHCSSNIEGIKLFKRVAWQTFGDKSSLKNTYGEENQLKWDFSESGAQEFRTQTDDECYYVKDIAKYVYEKYNHRDSVDIKEIYDDLDRHPIFPSDGYKSKIKEILKSAYGVQFPKSGEVIFRKRRE